MKITDKSFAVKVAGHLFTGQDIIKISIDGTDFEMEFGWCSNGEATVKCKTKDVEFLNLPHTPVLAQGRVVTGRDNTYTYYRVGDEPASDIEVISPLGTMRKAVEETFNQTAHMPQWRMKPYSEGFFDSIAKRIDEDNGIREVIKKSVRDTIKEIEVERVRKGMWSGGD